MYLVSCCPNDPDEEQAHDFAAELSELIEFKLIGIDIINDQPWHVRATEILEKYHTAASKSMASDKPLWRTLYEKYCGMDKSYSPNIVFMNLIRSFKHRIEADFPLQEINRSILIDYLEREEEKAMECD